MTVSQRGTPVIAAAAASLTPSIQGTWPTGSTQTAGDLLVAAVTAYGNTTCLLGTSPAGWVQVENSSSAVAGGNNTGIYVKIAAGGDTAPTFTAANTGTVADCSLQVVLYDLLDSGGGTPQLITGGDNIGTTLTITTTTTGNVPSAGCFAIVAGICSQSTTAATTTWTTPASWTLGADQLTSLTSQMASYYFAGPPSGSTLAVTLTHSRVSSAQSAAMIVVQPPAAGAIAVTARQSGTGAYNGLVFAVIVLTGAASSPIGTTASKVATTPNAAMTPAATGSWIYGAVNNNSGSAAWTAEAVSPFGINFADFYNGAAYGTFRTTATTTTGTPVTVGATNAGITLGCFAAAEIKTSGVLAEDASGTGVTLQATANAQDQQSNSFVPPAGALLVVPVATDGNTGAGLIVNMTVSDTSGLTWTEQVVFHTATNGYAGIWTAQVPGAGVVDRVSVTTTRQAVKRASLW